MWTSLNRRALSRPPTRQKIRKYLTMDDLDAAAPSVSGRSVRGSDANPSDGTAWVHRGDP
jgi:hypothetical protein